MTPAPQRGEKPINETNPALAWMSELADEDVKTVTVTVLHVLKKSEEKLNM